jgi:hypothetical protein
MDKTLKYLLIGLAVLVILVPIGLLAEGETYGEWANDWLDENLGYVPQGISDMTGFWNAPLPDYGLPGQGSTFADMTPGYIISALVGIALCGGLLYFGGKMLIKNKD